MRPPCDFFVLFLSGSRYGRLKSTDSINYIMKNFFRDGWLAGLVATLFLTDCARAQTPAPETKRILFFSKSSGFEHSVIKKNGDQPSLVEKVLVDLGKKNNIEFTFSKDGRLFTPENIAKYDAFFFYTTGDLTEAGGDKNPPMSPEGKAAFLDAIKNGKGFIGTHAATDSFHSPGYNSGGRYQNDGDNADPYIKMIGAEFIIHGGQQTSHLICEDRSFPGLSGFPSDFAPKEEWYTLKDFAPNLHVLLVQDSATMQTNRNNICYDRPPFPETWARMYGKGRVFYTSMGHRDDIWTNPVFQKVLLGGMNWALGNVDADVTPNLKKVAPQAGVLPPER